MDAQDEIKLSGLILQRSLEFVNDDEAWREFGYDKRPRYGSFFQKLRDQWKVNLERNLYREIIYFHIAFSFKNIDIIENEDQLESIIILLAYDLSGDNTNDDVYKDFGFNKREEFVDHIITSVQKYINTPTSEITNSFLENIKFGEIPNAEKKAEIIKGITFLKLLFSSHLNENQDEKKSVLGEKESNLSNELKELKKIMIGKKFI